MINSEVKSEILSRCRNISHGFLNKHGTANSGYLATVNNLNVIVRLKQIHSNRVHIIKDLDQPFSEGDSIITDIKGLGIGVYTADCVPVLMFDRKNIAVAAVHAGWKGSLLNIIDNCIKSLKNQFNTDPDDILAVIGPCIGSCCYVVKQDVAIKFIEKYPRADSFLYSLNSNEYNLDLKKFNYISLANSGVRSIEVIEKCTKCDLNYFSYRREGKGVGSQLSYIGISN